MEFPKSESEVVTLCEQMIAGFDTYGASFPSITAEAKAALESAKPSADGSRADQEAKRTIAKVATESKQAAHETLIEVMKKDLTLAELDCTDNPTLLGHIGWGPRAVPVPTVPPYPPGLLKVTAEGPGDIWFEWELLAKSPINNWIIERSQQLTPGGDWGPWTLAGTTVNMSAHLTDQPRGVQMMYRVKAVNIAGESEPSNYVTAVL